MAFWKQKYNRTDGFSLIEAVVAITILGIIAVPMLTSLLKSYQLNLRSDERMQAQLAVSSAVETIMAEGFDKTENVYDGRFSGVKIEETPLMDNSGNILYSGPAIRFTATYESEPDITVTTYARPHGTESPAPDSPVEGGSDGA